ncbi:MAG: 2-hydroxyglutaryl-CoA dehydratase [Candidatus Lokiarchaeota archaeon]|nr:2-hydroxyglutaryl-CoA dehydratase [Candidatus Lokiarchaeota archaeon]MBD3338226.1 2-hydroxyglutaryl-CoA dehydratase [Candidatus Lokiarchaeota archaeon]
MKAFVGIDIGSLATKIVILNDGKLIDSRTERSTYDFKRIGHNLFDELLEKNNLARSDVYVMSTGYGRNSIDIADDRITEITAHARGVQYFYPEAQSVIDIGGQDSKAIVISKKSGNVIDFQMNDKCAAGTGRFLEVMAHALEVDLENFGKLALKSSKPASISSTCTVFAESEVISLFARGASKEDIASGIHKSIARRVSGMAKRIGVAPPLVFCGGVAKNIAVKKYLEIELGFEVVTPEYPQLTGAIGAALIAQDKKS